MKPDPVFVPVEKLSSGIDKTRKQIDLLFESSEVLYNAKKYPLSIAVGILAEEEIAKLDVLREHVKSQKPITVTEWRQLRDHKSKLTSPYIEAKKSMAEVPEGQYETVKIARGILGFKDFDTPFDDLKTPIEQSAITNLEKLDRIKQDCFYSDFRNSDWFSFLTNLLPNHVEAIAFTRLIRLKMRYYDLLLGFDIAMLNNTTIQQLPQNPNAKKIMELNKIKETNNFKKKTFLADFALKKFYEFF